MVFSQSSFNCQDPPRDPKPVPGRPEDGLRIGDVKKYDGHPFWFFSNLSRALLKHKVYYY
jgi:hypothetical protein